MKKGKLIAIDGCDGSGKETQTGWLLEHMKSKKIKCSKIDFPRYNTPTGRIIGQSYLGKDPDFYGWKGDTGWFPEGASKVNPLIASVFYAADRNAAKKDISSKLDNGEILVADRYASANDIHQASKISDYEKRIEFLKKLDEMEYNYFENIRPDLTILLHMPYEVSYALREKRGIITKEKADQHEQDKEHLKNAEEAVIQLSELKGWPIIECAPLKTLDSLKDEKTIHQEIIHHINKKLNIQF